MTDSMHPHGVQADEGAMYRWVLREHDRLCPGACWASGKETWGDAEDE